MSHLEDWEIEARDEARFMASDTIDDVPENKSGICHDCNGSGEGACEDTVCRTCKGKGETA